MSARQAVAALTVWAALMVVLFLTSDGEPITGTVALAGIILVGANVRRFRRGRRTPISPRASPLAETSLGIGLLVFAVAGVFLSEHTIWVWALGVAIGTICLAGAVVLRSWIRTD